MALLFYATSYSPDRALAEIQKVLLGLSARRISYEYDSTAGRRRVAGISFSLEAAGFEREFLLPVRTERVKATLKRHGVLRGAGRRVDEDAQQAHAESVAWRTLLEWIKVQAALIDTQQVTPVEVMLPYMLVDGPNGSGTRSTVYEAFEMQAALPAGKS